MKGFYNVTNKIKESLDAEPFVNTISFGNIDDIDLGKQTLFPLSHVIVNNCTLGERTLNFNISILAMDIVDESKDATTDLYIGNDNEQDVLNTQLAILNRVTSLLKRGDIYTEKYQLEGDVVCEPFVDRFENKLAGWTATFNVTVENDMTIC